MAIKYPPDRGTILLCDFRDTIVPEMSKKRPVVVLASVSARLCIVVPLSTSEPEKQEAWHCLLNTPDPLPKPYDSKVHWVKGDMVSTVSFDRLFLPFKGKDKTGKRIYAIKKVSSADWDALRACVLAALFPECVDTNPF